MSQSKRGRGPIRAISIFLWVFLAMAAGSAAVESLLSNDGESMISQLGGDEDITGSIDQVSASNVDTELMELQTRALENRIADFAASLNQVLANNAELVRQLNDNSARMARMEESFSSMTASVPQMDDPAVAQSGPAALAASEGQAPVDQGIPLPSLKSPGNLSQEHFPFPANSKEMAATEPNQTHIDPGANRATSVAQTEFAIVITRSNDIEVLIQTWLDLTENHPEKMARLEPRVRFENSVGSGLEMALIAGPLRNASDAALLCVAVGLADKGCSPVVFTGEVIQGLARLGSGGN